MAEQLPEDYTPEAPDPLLKPSRRPRKPSVTRGKVRPGQGSVQSEDSVMRDRRAMELGVDGWSNAAIAKELGYRDGASVREAITRHTMKIVDQPARAVREMMLGQLDRAIEAAIAVMLTPSYKIQHGDLVVVPDPLNPGAEITLTDPGPRLAAANTLATLLDRKSKMLGIDPPERQEISITQLPAFVDTWLADKKRKVTGG